MVAAHKSDVDAADDAGAAGSGGTGTGGATAPVRRPASVAAVKAALEDYLEQSRALSGGVADLSSAAGDAAGDDAVAAPVTTLRGLEAGVPVRLEHLDCASMSVEATSARDGAKGLAPLLSMLRAL
jgi:hypothetical protein